MTWMTQVSSLCFVSKKNSPSLVMMPLLHVWQKCGVYLTKNRQVTPIFRRVPVFLLGANGAEIDEMEDVASSFASEGWGPAIAKTWWVFGGRREMSIPITEGTPTTKSPSLSAVWEWYSRSRRLWLCMPKKKNSKGAFFLDPKKNTLMKGDGPGTSNINQGDFMTCPTHVKNHHVTTLLN